MDGAPTIYAQSDLQAFDPIYCSADVKHFAFPGFEAPMQWWQDIRRTSQRPTRADLKFSDLRGLHDILMLTRVADDRSDLEIRIAGDVAMDTFHGRAKKGVSFRSLISTSDEQQAAHIGRIVDDFCLCINTGSVTLSCGERRKIVVIDLPLAPCDDDPCDYILSFYISKPLLYI